MAGIIFRNDDVSPNTPLMSLYGIYSLLKSKFSDCRIWSCITMFAKSNMYGSVYECVPFKDNKVQWFYDVDRSINSRDRIPGDVVSHGLLHVDHSKIDRDAQEMSILTSCRYLRTTTFVPPFNRFNEDTIDVCKEHGIYLVRPSEGWKSLEYEDFDPEHKYWYFHSWRWDSHNLEGKILNKVAA